MSRKSRVFLTIGKCYKKWFCMVVNNPLSRGLGNIAKLYLITSACGQSTCSKLKKHEICPYMIYSQTSIIRGTWAY